MPPVVVKTVPESGSKAIAPGEMEIKVTFSKEMRTDNSWSWSTAWQSSTLEVLGKPRFEADKRTCVLKVRVQPNKTYAYWLNSAGCRHFKDTQSRFTRISRSLAARFGLADPQAAVGKTDFDYFSEEHARQAYDDEQELIRTGRPIIDKEEKETWPDGHVTWVSTTKMPPMTKKTISWRTITAMVPSAPPRASAPTSPMNTCAGCVLNHKKASPAPAIAEQNTSNSPEPGM